MGRSIGIKRILCGIITLIMLSACSSNDAVNTPSAPSQTDSAVSAAHTICLPFSKRDSLNPYKAETKQNIELSKLLYDPLIKLNSSFDAELYVADNYLYESKKCTVKLKSVLFSDGSALTADDIVYSFKAAKQSPNYSKQLEAISASAADSSTVIFSMNYADPNMINLLDFPIIKSGTADLKDGNNRTIPPIGCGRYYFADGDALKLTANDNYYLGTINARSITLVDCPDDDSLMHYAASGTLSAVYSDMSDNSVPKMAGEYIKSSTTNLVFIGVNCNNGLLKDEKIRLAISSAVDRTDICENGYYGYAEPANNVFSPKWSRSKSIQSINVTQNIDQTVAYFTTIGYNEKDSDEFLVTSDGKRISFSLMYNLDNSARAAAAKCIAAELKKCGIEIIPHGVDYNTYKQNLSNGSFELYIGEVKLPKSFYIAGILSDNVIAGYPQGTVYQSSQEDEEQVIQPEHNSAASMFSRYYAGEIEIEAAMSAFASEMPFIPLAYRCGVTVAQGRLADTLKVSISDVYGSIENHFQ